MASDIPPRYRSATEYCFNEEQVDSIIETVASPRDDFRLTGISFPSSEHDNVRQSIATPFLRAPENDVSTGLGNLARLPVEILHEVLPHMDIGSLFALRQANLSSRRAVDSLPQYQRVISHGLDVFCALLRTRIAAHVSLLDFYDVLCTKACAVCGHELAEFVSLLAWGRCCFSCLHKGAPEVKVQALVSARSQFGLTPADAGQLRSFKTLPGTYSMDETDDKARTTVVSAHQAEMLSKGWSRPQRQPDPRQQPPLQQGLYLPSVGSGIRIPTQDAASVEKARDTRFRFMAACSLPSYDKRTGQAEIGVSCAGCCRLAIREPPVLENATIKWAYEAYERVYSREGLLQHFRWCRAAQAEWSWLNGVERPVWATPLPSWRLNGKSTVLKIAVRGRDMAEFLEGYHQMTAVVSSFSNNGNP